jgi:hypothetical protein
VESFSLEQNTIADPALEATHLGPDDWLLVQFSALALSKYVPIVA